jgi:two-component system, NtrC family, sensor kinase
MNASLRTKGILGMAVLIGYLALIGVFLTHQRQNLVLIVQDIEASQSTQTLLAALVGSLTHSIVESQDVLNSLEAAAGGPVDYGELPAHFDAIAAGLEQARKAFPALAPDVERYGRAIAQMRALPGGAHLAQVRDSEQQLAVKLHDMLPGLDKRSAELAQQYKDTQQFVSVFAISANVVGAVASVAVILIFFTRLAKDIKRLQGRAVAIVDGYSGEPLVNTRHDEVGGLIDAVNRMQVDLRRHEQQLEIARQQRFHQEKMAAVGSLAAAISHEVSNPIAAISGVAQFIVDETRHDDRPSGKSVNEFAAQILKQTERVTLILRQMATLTAPRSPDPELLDLNVLIQSTCGFIKYDKRLRGIEFEMDLRRDVPAVTAVADHITQVLMNLLINAADAMDHICEPGQRRIRIATSAADDAVHVSVRDNGRGMHPEVLAKAFEESFTTKPVGKGRGIGLFVCKTLIEKAGGRIALHSEPNKGTAAKLILPLCPPAKAPA